MNWKDYKQEAKRTWANFSEIHKIENGDLDRRMALLHCVLGIETEINEYKKAIINNDEVNAKEEIGDAYWYLANYELRFDIPIMSKSDLKGGSLDDCVETVLDLSKKVVFYKSDKFWGEVDLCMGSILYYLEDVVMSRRYDKASILQTNINKLKSRFPNKFTTKDADERDLDNERKILEQ